MLNITSIFESISGEGVSVGIPSTFIRLAGCNFVDHPCKWCDTPESQKIGGGTNIGLYEIWQKVVHFGHHNVIITGGEPLLQETGMQGLCDYLKKFDVEIETNGSIIPAEISEYKNVVWSVDMKCPSSGNISYNKYEWLDLLTDKDQLKFIIQDKHDFDFAKRVIEDKNIKAWLVFSPVWEKMESKQLVSWIKNIPRARLSLQIHKIIGVE